MAQPRSTAKRGGRARADDVFTRIEALARNLWWTWNAAPQRLFAALDPVIWHATGHNPIETLAQLAPHRREAIAGDPAFGEHLKQCERELREYLRAKTWFQRTATPKEKRLRVAYFCAEYGLHECLPQYAGGLGVLAGDHLKSASDLGIPLVGVGLLYRCGYYEQSFDREGATRAAYPQLDFDRLPITDTGKQVAVPIAARKVWARIWRVQVGRVPLYLLDTDVPGNKPKDRAITRSLYGGDEQTRLQQEIVLGIGGTRALEVVGQHPTVCHLNEGHAAFCAFERLRQFCQTGLPFDHAEERTWASTVFTTHTPVPAGHDRFAPALVMRHLGPLAEDLHLLRHEFLAMGRENPDDEKEPFCMTVLALGLSERANGVSKLHGQVSREMWQSVYSAPRVADVPIGHVTNGVHLADVAGTRRLSRSTPRYLKPRWVGAGPEDDWWKHAERIPPAELWAARNQLRRRLVHFIRARLLEQVTTPARAG